MALHDRRRRCVSALAPGFEQRQHVLRRDVRLDSGQLAAQGFEVKSREAGGEVQVGAKRIPVPRANWWKRLEAPASRAWVDVIELPDDAAAGKIPEQWRQPHAGTPYADAFVLITERVENGLDSVGAVEQ